VQGFKSSVDVCSIRWRRRDGRPVSDTWLQSDGSLQLSADVVNVAGFYQCLAENELGTAMSNFTVVHCKSRLVLTLLIDAWM